VKGRRKYSSAVREHESERFKGIAIAFTSIRETRYLTAVHSNSHVRLLNNNNRNRDVT